MSKSKRDPKNKPLYLDNNGTTQMGSEAIAMLTQWCKIAQNPSSSSKCAEKSKELIKLAKKELIKHCGGTGKYTVIYTSGATESNCFIIRSTVLAYNRIKKTKPTIIISAIEHESIMSCCKSLEEDNLVKIIYIIPNIEGSIPIASIEKAIAKNNDICLISIMFANNEIGTINNVKEIGALAHQHEIPFHVDAVQGFGKYKINLIKNNIDALSASFHKFNGPKGLGLLFINNDLISGYGLQGQINGTQQNSLRGGTENVPAIASSVVALKNTFNSRGEKNRKMLKMRNAIIKGLKDAYPIGEYADYVKRDIHNSVDFNGIDYDPAIGGFEEIDDSEFIEPVNDVEIVILGPPQNQITRILPNTILLSVAKNIHDKYGTFCNSKLRQDLDKKGVVVSVGSACNSSSDHASHVVNAIKAPSVIKRGIIRVSLGDENTPQDVEKFLSIFKSCVNKQIATKRSSTVKSTKPKSVSTKSSSTRSSILKSTKPKSVSIKSRSARSSTAKSAKTAKSVRINPKVKVINQ